LGTAQRKLLSLNKEKYNLMSKKPSVKASKASSAYSGINSYTVDLGPFSSSNTQQAGNSLNTQSSLSPALQGLFGISVDGLQNNAAALDQSPTEQLQDLNNGNNSYYNLNSALNQHYLNQQTAAIQHKMAQNGLDNSTVNGGLQGEALNNALLQDLSTRQAALNYSNQQANQNTNSLNSVLQSLYGFTQTPASLSSQAQQNGYNSQDQVARFNAQQQQQANIANAQLANQRALGYQQFLGNLGSASILSSGSGIRRRSNNSSVSGIKGLRFGTTINNSII
jgi:hypothetical protein